MNDLPNKAQVIEQISSQIYGMMEAGTRHAFELGYNAGLEQAEQELKKGAKVYGKLEATRWDSRIEFSVHTGELEKDMRFLREELGLVESKKWPNHFESNEVMVLILPLPEDSQDAYYRIGASKVHEKAMK